MVFFIRAGRFMKLTSRQMDAISRIGSACDEFEDAFGQDHPDLVVIVQDFAVLLNEELHKETGSNE